jgi:transcriptional regulator
VIGLSTELKSRVNGNHNVMNRSGSLTHRKQIIERLQEGPLSARELSKELSLSEREVYAHLPFVAQSARTKGARLKVLPFSCLTCGYLFRERKRFTPPSRCPRCRSTHLEKPTFRVFQQN